tara:strand:- start:3136 stop:4035 length:900 start_codon:yes stop_codon:yes gene_type:complete
MTTRLAKKNKGKGKGKTTEVRTDKKDPNKIRGEAPTRRNTEHQDALSRKPTRGHKRKERSRAVGKGHSRKQKHKQKHVASPARVASMFLLSRKTSELIRLKYNNLGDFGGTNPIQDSWVMEVAGPYEAMQEITPILKKYKFRWSPQSKSWRIDATLYTYSTRRRDNLWNAARRNQKAAWPILNEKVKEINERLRSEDPAAGKRTDDMRQFVKEIHQDKRIISRLENMGITVGQDVPDRYSVDESKVVLLGNTYGIKDILKRYGFRFGRSRAGKGWMIPMREFNAISRELVADIAQATGE